VRDLVIAGGGPVGLATALYAVRAGLDVVVREPRDGVIDKACGEGLMPGAVAALAGLGLDPAGSTITGIRYLDPTHAVEAPFRHGPGRGVRRTVLHACLRDAVAAAGIPVEPRAVRTLEQRADHVLVDGEPAHYLVAADGLHSPVRRLAGLEATSRLPRRYGLRCHVETEAWTSFVEVHWSRDAEAYVTPVGPSQVGVALLSGTRQPFDRLVAGIPALADRLGGLEASRVMGAGPLRQRARHRVTGRVLLVGDAAGYVDALTGEGISGGLAQAHAAVEALRADAPERYERDWRRLMWRHDLLTHTLLATTRPAALRRLLVPAATRLPRVFGAAVNQLASPA
jgi:flavin-dependent dehydrogenase